MCEIQSECSEMAGMLVICERDVKEVVIFVVKDTVPRFVVSPTTEAALIILESWRLVLC
jgi:hypothetical protein